MLPFELLEYIVDFLHDDSNALRACSLTCQSLIPAARKYLFRRIVLKRVSDTLRFLQALDSSADTQFSVASYVRDLRLPFMGFVKGGKKQRRYELVRRVLRNLQHLSQLRMYIFDWLGFMESLRVDAGAGSLRDAMAAFFPLQELKELIIDHLVSRSSYELTLFISIFPQLEQLEMRQLISLHAPGTWVPLPDAPGGWDKDLPAAGEMGTHLRTLAVSFDLGSQTMAGRVLGRLLSSPFHVQCSHIEWETCQVALRREDDIDEGVLLIAVLRASELTLESLRVSCSDDVWLRDLDLSRCRRLTHLTFVFRRESPDLFLAELPSFLSRLSEGGIEEVHFHTDADEDVGLGWNTIDWPRMDEALALLHKRRPSLIVIFHFSSLRPAEYGKPDVVGPLTQRIPVALGAGMRVASILSSVLISLPDEPEDLERKFRVLPDEQHWLTVAAQQSVI